MSGPVLSARGLEVQIGSGRSARTIVHGVDLEVASGECVGLVGESGSGKSMTIRSIIGLLPRGAHLTAGELRYAPEGRALESYEPSDVRGHGIAMIFQEPMTALNPTRRAGDLVADGVRAAGRGSLTRREARRRAIDLLAEAGIPEPERRARAFPHQLSGGLRQRVMIAMSLTGDPSVLLCDEPTTALDVTVQDQILCLLDRLRRERGLALVFVTHDLGVVASMAQQIHVMHHGQVVERGTTAEVLTRPTHPHTRSLLEAAVALEGRRATTTHRQIASTGTRS